MNQLRAQNIVMLQDQLEAAADGVSVAVCQTLALGQEMLPVVATLWAFAHVWATQQLTWPALLYSSCTYEQHLKISSEYAVCTYTSISLPAWKNSGYSLLL